LKLYQYIASVSGIGYIKGGGTIAAAVTVFFWYGLMPDNVSIQIVLTLVMGFVGVWVANKTESDWGKDSSRVVIDEVLGMMVTLLLLPVSIPVIVGGFVLFRFFDILKPWGIRRCERLPRGWGVMADDVLSGVYANVILHLIILL
jgi:phosphatidylglycerophosphatase A